MKRRVYHIAILTSVALLTFAVPVLAEEPGQSGPVEVRNAEGKVIFDKKYAIQLLASQTALRDKIRKANIEDISYDDLLSLAMGLLSENVYPKDPFIDDPQNVLLWNSLKIYYGNRDFIVAYCDLLLDVQRKDLINRYKAWKKCWEWFSSKSEKYDKWMRSDFSPAYRKVIPIIKAKFGYIITGTLEARAISLNAVLEEAGLKKIYDYEKIQPEIFNQLRDLDIHIEAVRKNYDKFKSQWTGLQELVKKASELKKQAEAQVTSAARQGNANQSTMIPALFNPDRDVIAKIEELANKCQETYDDFRTHAWVRDLIDHKVNSDVFQPYNNPDISYVETFRRLHQKLRAENNYWNDQIAKHSARKMK